MNSPAVRIPRYAWSVLMGVGSMLTLVFVGFTAWTAMTIIEHGQHLARLEGKLEFVIDQLQDQNMWVPLDLEEESND